MFMGKLFVVVIALLGLAGCSQEEPPSKAEAPRTELAYASTKDIRNINPHLYSGEMAAQNMVFEPLVVNTKEGVKPWLAERWEISPDGKEYTFHLRKDVAFTDGTPFNAEAVKANMDAIVSTFPGTRGWTWSTKSTAMRPLTNIPTSWCSSIPTTLRW